MRSPARLLAVWICWAAPPIGAQEIAPIAERLTRELQALRARDHFPGATAAFALPDGRIGAVVVGLADVEHRIPMTADTKMLAASIGKTFVSATALALASEGRLGLDDRISRWVGNAPWFARLPNADVITIRMLGTHTSGVPNHVSSPRFWADWKAGRAANPDFAQEPNQLVDYVTDLPAAFPPGKGYLYTDTGYLILGLIVEAAGGEPFYAQAKRRFVDPLGLRSTVPSNSRTIPGLAVGYLGPNRFFLPEQTGDTVGSMSWNPALEWTGGGFATTPSDLVRWAMTLYQGKAMSGSYLDQLLTLGATPEPGGSRYGFGVRVSRIPLGKAYGHGGSIPGFRSQLLYFPDRCVAVALQVNTSTGPADERLPAYAESLAAIVLRSAPSACPPVRPSARP